MALTNPQNPNCPNCNKSGLAILPVRYAVVPLDISAKLPESLGDKVTSTKLSHNKYALRTLRQGFLYLLHEKHPRERPQEMGNLCRFCGRDVMAENRPNCTRTRQ